MSYKDTNGTYHVNPFTGEPGKCRAFLSPCPFGSPEVHHKTIEDARQAYEDSQETFNEPLSKKAKGPKTMKVYRSGEPVPPVKVHENIEAIEKYMDSFKPEGRQGRSGGIFVSPDIDSHSRWVYAAFTRKPSFELTVNPDNVYVYPIHVYEEASFAQEKGKLEEAATHAKDFWAYGMTLREYTVWAAKAKPAPGSWEMMLSPEDIIESKELNDKRMWQKMSDEAPYKKDLRHKFYGN